MATTVRVLLAIVAAGLVGCSSVVTLTDVDAGMSVVVPAQPNAAANGAEVVPIVVRLATRAGQPLNGLQVSLTSEHCILAQPTGPTDASGTVRGQVRCASPGLQTVGITLAFNDAKAPLQVSAQVNFYPAADSRGAVLGGTELMAQAVAYDANNTVDITYRGTVAFSSTDPLASLPQAQTLGASDHGYRALPKSLILRTEGRQTVTCTDVATGRVMSSQTLVVVPAPVTALKVLVQESTLIAGVFTSMTVSSVDGYGNVNPVYTGTVSFASTDPLGQLPSPYTFTPSDQGSKTFLNSISLRTAGRQQVFAQNGALSGLQTVTVQGGPVTGLQLVLNSSAVAGQPEDVTVQAVDVYGNPSSSYAGTVLFRSSDPAATVPTDVQITPADSGTVTKKQALTLYIAGLSSLLASDSNNAAIQVATVDIRTAAAAPQRLTVALPSSATAGDSLNPIVVAQDAYGNAAPSYRGTVSFSVSDPMGVVPASYTFQTIDAGAHAFVQRLRLLTAGTITTAVRDSAGLQGGTATTTVAPGPLSALQVSGAASAAAGSSIDLTITAVDAYGNVVPGFNDTVQLSNADPRGSCVSSATLDQGAATVSVGASFVSSGTWIVSASDSVTGTLGSIPLQVQVLAGPLVSLNLNLPLNLHGSANTASVGQLLTPIVSAFDAYEKPRRRLPGHRALYLQRPRCGAPCRPYFHRQRCRQCHLHQLTEPALGLQQHVGHGHRCRHLPERLGHRHPSVPPLWLLRRRE